MSAVSASEDYFVSGSLSFLPLAPYYREPEHDVDVAMSSALFQACHAQLAWDGWTEWLALGEIAVANRCIVARALPFRSSFVHIHTPEGLLDIACFDRRRDRLVFRLGAGLTLELPASVLDHVRELSWRGIAYRAGPPELALIPKLASAAPGDAKHAEDLRRLRPLIRGDLVERLLASGGIRWLRLPLPRCLDPLYAALRAAGVTSRNLLVRPLQDRAAGGFYLRRLSRATKSCGAAPSTCRSSDRRTEG
jgi:hypothetical protein